ncbi:MAG: VWA domain-containing protein [Gemmataceae bacterium]
MVAQLVALGAAMVMTVAELTHAARVRHVAALAFGPSRRAALWTWLAPPLRVLAATGLAWGLMTLLTIAPKVHKLGVLPENEFRDLVLVLDVSPSMRLADAGPDRKLSRRKRASDLLKSFFERTPMELYRTTVVAVYTEALPVVERTTDPEVIRNILEDLPMEYAFKAGPTDLITGVKEACRIAQPWRPGATTLVIVSDGDTIPPTGLPRLPASIAHVVIVGVGDPAKGTFVAGHLSRQDVSSLRQLAVRLGGTYHDGNEKHLSTALVQQVTLVGKQSPFERLTRREYALMAIAGGAGVLSLLPLLLHLVGTTWRPGVRTQPGR